MKYTLSLILLGILPATASEKTPSNNFLWYKQPARVKDIKLPWGTDKSGNLGDAQNNPGNPWEKQALPIGNGRIGVMIFGGDTTERLALNEVSFWSGGSNPNGEQYNYGPNAGKDQFGCYLPFGDLFVSFNGEGEAQNYTRSLNLKDGIARVSYEKNGVTYKRTLFASEPSQVIVMHCTADKAGAFGAKFAFKPTVEASISASGNTLTMSGTLKNGLEYEAVAVVIPQKGKISAKGGTKKLTPNTKNEADVDLSSAPWLEVSGAQGATVIISMATNYVMDYSKNWKGASPHSHNKAYLAKSAKKQVKELQKAHTAFYKKLFDRVKIDLGKSPEAKIALPTDQRIKNYGADPNDPELISTIYQYGRYMLIAGSRPGNLPANLQGIWNNSVTPPWASDYHNNINVQMCYWGAEAANLSECHKPLLDYITAMAPALREATQNSKEFNTKTGKPIRGWTARTSQNIWGASGWKWNIPASAWYALHMWEHYRFTKDKDFLKKQAYPMMKETCQFWEDHLKELGEGGKGFFSDKGADLSQLKDIKAGTLVAPNGWSPEQGPREDGVAHDQQLIWELFDSAIQAAQELKTDGAWASQLAKKRDRLYLHKVSKDGYLQEWMIDRPNLVTGHRHTSHLFGVYPGSIISPEKTPDIAKAAEKSLELRGTTGDCRRSWTWPWRTALWARFRNGEKAYEMVQGLIRHNMLDNMIATHPPLQFDGTYGITGGISEMLLQSHAGKIELLPALPSAWKEGSVHGLKARGNITVDISWKDGKVTSFKLKSPTPSAPVKVIVNGEEKSVTPTAERTSPAHSRTISS